MVDCRHQPGGGWVGGWHHNMKRWVGGWHHNMKRWVGGWHHNMKRWVGGWHHNMKRWVGGWHHNMKSWVGGWHHNMKRWVGGWHHNMKRWVAQARCFRYYPLTLLDLLWRVLGCQKGGPSNDLPWSVYHQMICLGQFTIKWFVLVSLPSNYLSWSVYHQIIICIGQLITHVYLLLMP